MYLVGVEENNGVLRSLCSLAAGCQSQAWAPCLSYSLICLMITVSDDVQIDYLWLENNGEIMKNILNTLKGPSIFFVSYKFTLWHQAGQESLRTQCLPPHSPDWFTFNGSGFYHSTKTDMRDSDSCFKWARFASYGVNCSHHIVLQSQDETKTWHHTSHITHYTSHSPLTCLCRQWLPLTGSTLPFPKVTQVNIINYLNSRAQYFIHFSSEGTCNMWWSFISKHKDYICVNHRVNQPEMKLNHHTLADSDFWIFFQIFFINLQKIMIKYIFGMR